MEYSIEFAIVSVVVICILWAIALLLQDIKNEATYHNSFVRRHLTIIHDSSVRVENKLDNKGE